MNKPTNFPAHRIALIAMMSTLAYIGRIVCQPFPNIQPVTIMILLITIYIGLIDGMLVAVLSMFLSNIMLGMGPWTIAQIVTYIILTILMYLVGRRLIALPRKIQIGVMSLFVFLLGILYGFIISTMTYNMFGLNHFWPYYFQGIAFDILHGLGNVLFYLCLTPLLRPILLKFKL